MLVALDINLETESPFDFACGEVGEIQLCALKTLQTFSDVTKIVFMHHHPLIHNNTFMEMKDARELVQSIYKQVHVVLFGHTHEPGSWQNCWGAKFAFASVKSPDLNVAREIVVDDGKIRKGYIHYETGGKS